MKNTKKPANERDAPMTTAFQNSYLRRILLVIAALWGQSGVCALLDRLDRAFPRWLAGN